MPVNLEVQLYGSPIGCPPDQRATVIGLGLRRVNSRRVLKDSPEVRGMIAKIPHLVRILKTDLKKEKK
ncbi:MAG: 50S ribosomal protein L30 [Deltaproteobacteria bacterium]|nr:50S ribosomal protein L30 [Deltaproteobacteria bacterium]